MSASCTTSPTPASYNIIIVIIMLLPSAQGSEQLSREELRLVFGDTLQVPEYSMFLPRVVYGGESGGGGDDNHRHSRSLNPQSPTLQFQALGRSFNFKLEQNLDLVSRDFVFLGRDGAVVDVQEVGPGQLDCFYQGVDQDQHNHTSIAIELCGKLRGVMASPTQEYVIEPLPLKVNSRRRRSSASSSPSPTHVIYARRTNPGQKAYTQSRSRRSFTSPDHGGDEGVRERGELGGREEVAAARQQRRSYFDSFEHVIDSRLRSEWAGPEDFGDRNYGRDEDESGDSEKQHDGYEIWEDLYIETSVFVDQDLYRHMLGNFPEDTEEQVLSVVLAMVNAVQLLYNDPSLGHRVKFVLKRLEILYRDPPDLLRSHDIDHFLTNFCNWQRGQNPERDSDPLHWDHALILTGLDVYTITDKGRVNSQVVGLAPVAGMCTRASSCTVNEGRHFESVYVMAHEIGHNLGMRHDGLQADNNCDPGRYIMSPTLGSGKITWSSCSRRYLRDFLRSEQSWCLEDRAAPETPQLDHQAHSLPGQRFPVDQQCVLKHGRGSHHAGSQALEDICQDLHCRRDHYTWTSHPALEGTTCGQRKWCQRGQCVEDSEAPPLTPSTTPSSSYSSTSSSSSTSSLSLGGTGSQGVRGEWGPWSQCRSQCLYGVDGLLSSGSSGLALSERRCRTCRGEYRYRLCFGEDECVSGPRMTLQDYAHNTCRTLARTSSLLTGAATRVPDRGPIHCEVDCETSRRGVQTSSRSFPDGSVCHSPSSLPAFCVAGACTEFRCEPDTLYGADPLTCRPDMGAPDPHRPLGPQHYHPQSAATHHSSPSTLWPATTTLPTSQWGPWKSASVCRYSCLRPAKGIQLVSRECLDRGCSGVTRNIQVCTPPNPVSCDKLVTPFEYASDVCDRFRDNVDKLSGVGMQLASTGDDPDRPCTVACQDVKLDYRFYRVNGRDGWFPFGTDCSRDRGGRHSYCLNGKCLDFSDEGTPLRNTIYTEYDRSRGRSMDLELIEEGIPLSHESSWPRSWRNRRDLTSSSHLLSSTLTDQLLLSLVDQVNQTLTTRGSIAEDPASFVDFKNPLFVSYLPPAVRHNQTMVIHPASFTLTPLNIQARHNRNISSEFKDEMVTQYRWRLVVVSPCSVTCGQGLEEVKVVCTLWMSETDVREVPDWRCSPSPSPTVSGFRWCEGLGACPTHPASISVIGRWLEAILKQVKSKGSSLIV